MGKLVIALVVVAGLAWVAGIYTTLWWLKEKHPAIYSLLDIAMEREKEVDE